jgi:ferrous iron transport protein B
MWEKAKDFVVRAFTLIFAASVVIWLLQSFDWGFNAVADSSDSILASVGSIIAPIFKPLGFGDWRASTALITGVTAKESVVSTLTVLTGAATEEALYAALGGVFTPLSAVSFLVFTLLYCPCVAAFAAMKRELGLKRAIFSIAYETAFAYVAALLVYQVGSLAA